MLPKSAPFSDFYFFKFNLSSISAPMYHQCPQTIIAELSIVQPCSMQISAPFAWMLTVLIDFCCKGYIIDTAQIKYITHVETYCVISMTDIELVTLESAVIISCW